VVVEVSDTGIGIPEAELPYIFDRFRQADGSSTRSYSGIGIGLSLAKELAEKHGGQLSAESRLGEGTTFRLRLGSHDLAGAEGPRAAEPAPVDDSMAELSREADRFVAVEDEAANQDQVAGACSSTATVLVVDDEPDMRRYLSSVLADRYAVLSATDGTEGLALARQARPELVLVDLMMPRMDGWQLCARLKQSVDGATPKVVVVTARTDELAKIRALEAGADDFLGKPFSPLEVRTRLSNLHRAYCLETNLRRQNSELVAAIKQLRSTEAQLVQREKMVAVTRMAGGILHEINNPLNITLTAIGVALDRIPSTNSALREIVGDVEAGMLRIRDIVADLRDFANPGSGERREWFDFNRVVDRALQLASTQLKGIRVERNVPDRCQTYGSESQLLQVLVNLLLNAEAAVRELKVNREPTIRIAAAEGAGHRHVSVWDNGIGIPSSLLKKIVDPFVTTRDVGQGLGLGLSICHTLVAAHGGRMTVHSDEGEWTEVAIELPLLPKEDVK
jgi:signal transduction histidine kinase